MYLSQRCDNMPLFLDRKHAHIIEKQLGPRKSHLTIGRPPRHPIATEEHVIINSEIEPRYRRELKQIRQSPERPLPFANNRFDTATITNPEKEITTRILEEIRRVLRPKGRILILSPHPATATIKNYKSQSSQELIHLHAKSGYTRIQTGKYLMGLWQWITASK